MNLIALKRFYNSDSFQINMFADILQITPRCRFILQKRRLFIVFNNIEYSDVNALCVCFYAFAPHSGF
jgi:hypothetical protein